MIENTIGQLPYRLIDYDQHLYEPHDCFTRHMPKAKLDTSIYPVKTPSGQQVLLANDRVVTGLEREQSDMAYLPGSLVEMLRQRASGNASDAERFLSRFSRSTWIGMCGCASSLSSRSRRRFSIPAGR